MLRSVASRVMWVGRATVFLVGLAVILALVLGLATSALGATGQNFILGKVKNTAETPTGLVSTLADAAKSALIVTNKSGGPALDLRVGNAELPANVVAPMKVNSNRVVTNLNADRLDGLDSSEFLADALFTTQGPLSAGVEITLSDGQKVHRNSASCGGNEATLSGGPVLINDGTTVLNSFPEAGGWIVDVKHDGTLDQFRVQVLCVRR